MFIFVFYFIFFPIQAKMKLFLFVFHVGILKITLRVSVCECVNEWVVWFSVDSWCFGVLLGMIRYVLHRPAVPQLLVYKPYDAG